MLYVLIKYLLTPLFYLIFRPMVYGAHNLWIKGKAIFVCNHIAMADPIFLAFVSPRFIHFMGKSELFSKWYGRFFLKALLVFPVNRKQADMQSMKKAIKVLDSGKVFGIFPEGKRAITHDIDELEKGAAFLAVRTNAPIVPMYIKRDCYKRCRFFMAVGEPISTFDLAKRTQKAMLIDVVTNEISDSLRALQTQLED